MVVDSFGVETAVHSTGAASRLSSKQSIDFVRRDGSLRRWPAAKSCGIHLMRNHGDGRCRRPSSRLLCLGLIPWRREKLHRLFSVFRIPDVNFTGKRTRGQTLRAGMHRQCIDPIGMAGE